MKLIINKVSQWSTNIYPPEDGGMQSQLLEDPAGLKVENETLRVELGRLRQSVQEQQGAIGAENEILKVELARLKEFVEKEQRTIIDENDALRRELGRLQQFVEEEQRTIVDENDALRRELGRLQQFVEEEQRSIVEENEALRSEVGRLQWQIDASLQSFIDSQAPAAPAGTAADEAWLEIGRAASRGIAIQRVPQICFLHISKTAGTSVQHLLRSAIRGPVFQADFDEVTREELRPFSLVMGHMSYNHTRKLRRPYTLITFLRDPIERVISTYFYLRRSDDSSRLAEFSRNLSFRQFLMCEDPDVISFVRDHQTYALASDYRTHRCYDRDMVLSAAWGHLQEFAFVGFVEHFEVSMKRLSRLLGVPFRTPPLLNVTPETAKDALNDADLALARELNELDCRLYELAVERFLPTLLSRRRYAKGLLQYRDRLRRERERRRSS